MKDNKIGLVLTIAVAIALFSLMVKFNIIPNPFQRGKANKLRKNLKVSQADAEKIFTEAYKGTNVPKRSQSTTEIAGLSMAEIKEVAEDIYNAKGTFNDNEDTLYSAFRKIPTKFAAILVSIALKSYYTKDRDLISYVEDFTNTEEQSKIWDIIKNNPEYLKPKADKYKSRKAGE
jgi:hypothetical protein